MPYTNLVSAVSDLYGMSVSVAAIEYAERAVTSRAMGDIAHYSWSALVDQFLPHQRPWVLALEQAHYSDVYLQLSGFLTDAVLIGEPYRHEAVWLHLPTGRAWCYDEGLRDLGGPAESLDKESFDATPPEELSRMWGTVRWLAPLLANFDSPDAQLAEAAFDSWLTDHDATSVERLLYEYYEARQTGTASALKTLWGLFALGDDAMMNSFADGLLSHAARVVRSAAGFALSDLARSGPIADRVRRRRALFLERVG